MGARYDGQSAARQETVYRVHDGPDAHPERPDRPWGRTYNVIQCAGGMAVVRCSPAQRESCIAAVREADASCRPVAASGTLRTLRDRYQVLRDNIPPRPQNHVRAPAGPSADGGPSKINARDYSLP